LWYYDDDGNFVMGSRRKRRVRQGCVLGMFLFFLKVEPMYSRLRVAMGEQDALYAYCVDSYLVAEQQKLA